MRLTDSERARRLRFLTRRQRGIGGSDMPVILGLSTYIPEGRSNPRNAIDIFHDKTRPIREEDIQDDNIHQLRGHSFEGMALEHYTRKTGRTVTAVDPKEGTFHPEYPNVIVSRDFQIEPDEERAEGFRGRGTGETKAPVKEVFGHVIDHGLRQSELIQLQTNIAASQDEWGGFCYFNMEHNKGPVLAPDQMADPVMGKFLLEAGQRFWNEHVVTGIRPVPSEWKLLEDENAPVIIDMSGELELLTNAVFRKLVARCLDRKDTKNDAEAQYRETLAEVFEWLKAYPCPECSGKADDCPRCDGAGTVPIGKAQLTELARLTVVTKKGSTSRSWPQLVDALPLDRDMVARWLAEWDSRFRDDPKWKVALGRMLFECELDLTAFETVGHQSQYLLANRSKK